MYENVVVCRCRLSVERRKSHNREGKSYRGIIAKRFNMNKNYRWIRVAVSQQFVPVTSLKTEFKFVIRYHYRYRLLQD